MNKNIRADFLIFVKLNQYLPRLCIYLLLGCYCVAVVLKSFYHFLLKLIFYPYEPQKLKTIHSNTSKFMFIISFAKLLFRNPVRYTIYTIRFNLVESKVIKAL